MQSLKSYFLTCFLLSFCSIILAQENEDWLPADSIYLWGIEAYAENDDELTEQCSLYLWNASKFYLNNNEHKTALKYAFSERDLTLIKYGKNSHQYALSLGNIAEIHEALGLYVEASDYNKQAFDIEFAICGEDSTSFITPLHNFACNLSAFGGDYIAIDLMKVAIYYKDKANYPQESLISSLSALAVMYSHIGDYETAFYLNLEVVRYRQSIPLSEDLALSYSNLACDLNDLGLTQEAIEYVKKGLAIQTDSLGKRYSTITSAMYSNLANYYYSIQEYDSAIIEANNAIEIGNYINEPITNAYSFISAAYEQKNDTFNTLYYAELLVNEYAEKSNLYHGNLLIALNNYAMYLYKFGYIEDYIQIYLNYYSQLRFYLKHMLYSVAPSSAYSTWVKYGDELICHNNNIKAIIQNDSLRTIIYDNTLLYKGVLLQIERNIAQTIRQNKQSKEYNSLLSKYNSIQDEEEKVLQKFRIETVEKRNMTDFNDIDSISIDTIKRSLKLQDIAIEIIDSKRLKDNFYYALILRKDWNTPKCVILGSEAELDSMSYPKLQQAVWQAIIDSAQIKEGENIYFAPDGIFYNMPIEYLPTADGRNMSDKYNMFRVSSTRELCYRETANTYSTAVLYGGLKYDATPQNLIAKNSSTRGWEESIHESVLSQWRADDRAKYNYLPYTLMEVDSISQTIGNAIQVTTYTDKEGSEESFKSLSGHSPSILHIATHGYYITPTKAEMMSKENLYRYGLTAMDDRPSVIDYSMERTGLLMAGAQLKLRGDSVPQMAEDGILSAKEISHLDLSNTDLVVLSACQTALGDITNDGVAGLQRGFKIAGVKSVLMSLWKVDDAATYLLMKQFYKSLFAGKNKQQALRDAQNYLRSYMVGNEHPYNDIHYWGAFVLLDAIEK